MPAESSQQMIAYVEPPASPPTAAIGRLMLEPTMVQWRIDGDYNQSDVSQEDSLPVNDTPTAREDLMVQVSEANRTTEVKLRVFDSLGGNGYPQPGDIGTGYLCSADGTGMCSVAFNADGSGAISIHPTRHGEGSAALYVLQAFYPTAEDVDMDASITAYTISWAVRDAT